MIFFLVATSNNLIAAIQIANIQTSHWTPKFISLEEKIDDDFDTYFNYYNDMFVKKSF